MFNPAAVVPAQPSNRERDDWETPPGLFAIYHETHRFTIDVAANAANRMVPRYFDTETDGLTQSWLGERVWLHPPHGDAGRWAHRAVHWQRRGVLTIALLPARTYEPWWHDAVFPYARVRYLMGHLDWRLARLPVSGQRKIEGPRGGFAIVEWHPPSHV